MNFEFKFKFKQLRIVEGILVISDHDYIYVKLEKQTTVHKLVALLRKTGIPQNSLTLTLIVQYTDIAHIKIAHTVGSKCSKSVTMKVDIQKNFLAFKRRG